MTFVDKDEASSQAAFVGKVCQTPDLIGWPDWQVEDVAIQHYKALTQLALPDLNELPIRLVPSRSPNFRSRPAGIVQEYHRPRILCFTTNFYDRNTSLTVNFPMNSAIAVLAARVTPHGGMYAIARLSSGITTCLRHTPEGKGIYSVIIDDNPPLPDADEDIVQSLISESGIATASPKEIWATIGNAVRMLSLS